MAACIIFRPAKAGTKSGIYLVILSSKPNWPQLLRPEIYNKIK